MEVTRGKGDKIRVGTAAGEMSVKEACSPVGLDGVRTSSDSLGEEASPCDHRLLDRLLSKDIAHNVKVIHFM